MRDTLDIGPETFGLTKGTFRDSVAVVTGAGQGIGRELSIVMASLGAAIAVVDIDEAAGAETASIIVSTGCNAAFFHGDVASEESVTHLFNKVMGKYKRVDFLVNNAIVCPIASLLELSVGDWDRVMSVNLKGAFLMVRAFLPEMIKAGSGCIVNMTSTSGMPYLGAYMASKEGLRALSVSLAGEVESLGINVLSYGPGIVDTPGGRRAFQLLAQRLGMDYEEFVTNGINAGYEGLIPSRDTACSLAWVMKNGADYRGENVMFADVLDRLGLLEPILSGAASTGGGMPGHTMSPIEGITVLRELWRRVLNDLEDTKSEIEGFPFFLRPMAKSGFKAKAVLSLDGWLESVACLCREGHVPEEDVGRLPGKDIDSTRSILAGLAKYYRDCPAEAGKFTRDAKALDEIVKRSLAREARVLDVLGALGPMRTV